MFIFWNDMLVLREMQQDTPFPHSQTFCQPTLINQLIYLFIYYKFPKSVFFIYEKCEMSFRFQPVELLILELFKSCYFTHFLAYHQLQKKIFQVLLELLGDLSMQSWIKFNRLAIAGNHSMISMFVDNGSSCESKSLRNGFENLFWPISVNVFV